MKRNDESVQTKIYGASDDLVEMEGGYNAESNGDDLTLLINDGTVLDVRYGASGIWRISLVKAGPLFDRIDVCQGDGDGDDYSDVAWMKPGVRRIYEGRLAK